MNPYLEQDEIWRDFHNAFNTHLRDQIVQNLGNDYVVRLEQRLLLHERSAEERRFIGITDVGVVEVERRNRAGLLATLPAPVQLQLPAVEVEKHHFIEIRDKSNRRVITVIELLSRSNKKGADFEDYQTKRHQLLKSSCHFVEIDLLRAGKRPVPPELPKCDYYYFVSRSEDRPTIGVWPIGLRDPLPKLPIPLADPDPALWIDLKRVLDRTYDAAGYANYIYQGKPDPPLNADDASWAEQVLGRSI